MKNILRLFRVLDRWKGYYALAGLLLLLSSLIRMLEPKIIQLAVDGVVGLANQQATAQPPDAILQLFYTILPEIRPDNLGYVLFCIGLLFVIISILQAAARFTAGTLSASSTEKAAQRLRNLLFAHIQALSLSQLDKFPKGEMIQRCTGDIDTIRRFMNDQVAELLRMLGIVIGSFVMMAMMHLPTPCCRWH